MYKNIIRAAFLFATGIFMTACSSGDDNFADNTTPVTPDTKEVTLTGIISASGDLTRAVGDGGKSVYWQENDEICVQYTSKDGVTNVKGKITEVVDEHNAKFTATLTNLAPNSTSNSIGLAYPYSNVTAGGSTVTDFSFDNSLLATQEGTIDGINNAKLDIAWTTEAVGITIDKANATLNNGAILTNQVCIAKFTLYEGTSGKTPFNTTSLTVTDNTNSKNYAVTTTTKTNEFFVVLPPINNGSITIKATGQQKYTETPTPTEITSSRTDYTYGQYIVVDPSTRKAYTAAVSNTSNDTEYSKTYANSKLKAGKFYAQQINIGQDYIPVAVIAYVGNVTNYWDKFLALGLSDVTTNPIEATSSVSSETTAAITAWMTNNNMTIDGNPYNSLYAVHYDEVPESPQVGRVGDEYNHYAKEFESSQTRSTTGVTGWRVPSVTDFRYIIQSVTGNRVSATNPIGVMDFNGIYQLDSDSHVLTQSGYGVGENIAGGINSLCHNSKFDTHYYWTSSELDVNHDKGWRFNSNNNYFIWSQATSGASDMAKVRPVFAY